MSFFDKYRKMDSNSGKEIIARPVQMTDFKKQTNFRKVEQIILKCCSLCFYSRINKQKMKNQNIDFIVCSYNPEYMFPVDWEHVCDNFN